jgi:hypothetical protein
MDIRQSTREYEKWMRTCVPLVEGDLRDKHAKMKEDPFQFLRGSYYRWAQVWPELCADLLNAPIVFSVGDLHVDSFGTWRDFEGRLCWGVDDFDEAWPLPYSNDLVRLAASVKIARKLGLLDMRSRETCEIILDAYEHTLKQNGCPIVLAEQERQLEKLGIAALKTPIRFWDKLNKRPIFIGRLPAGAKNSLQGSLPDRHLKYRVIQREAGLGSLGQQRFVAIADWHGGCVAREAKRLVPSANQWLKGRNGAARFYYEKIMKSAVRSRDPFQKVYKSWLMRRLSPDSNPIHMSELTGKRDETILIRAMGTEAANIHLGSHRTKQILIDLKKRKPDWLRLAAKKMAKSLVREWKQFRN